MTSPRIRYQIDSERPASLDLTYTGASGGTLRVRAVSPWALEFAALPGDRIYVSADNLGWGAIRLQVFVDGWLWRESRAVGHRHVAAVSGVVP